MTFRSLVSMMMMTSMVFMTLVIMISVLFDGCDEFEWFLNGLSGFILAQSGFGRS